MGLNLFYFTKIKWEQVPPLNLYVPSGLNCTLDDQTSLGTLDWAPAFDLFTIKLAVCLLLFSAFMLFLAS